MFCKAKSAKKEKFFSRGKFRKLSNKKCSKVRPLLSITFPQGFRISKNIAHSTSGSGGKKTFKRYLKSEQTHRQTDRRTNRLIESIGPEGQCFEKLSGQLFSFNSLKGSVVHKCLRILPLQQSPATPGLLIIYII